MVGSRVIIVGAGLGGSLMACFLGRRGYDVEVYERRPDPRKSGFVGGRSINLALSTRGIAALERVGLAERVLADAVPMRGRMMHGPTGATSFQPYSKNANDAINSVSRGGLNLTLVEAAEALDNVNVHFDARCVDVHPEDGAAVFERAKGPERIAGADLIVGADGAFSAVRAVLQRTDGFDYSQSYLEHGYKELTIPPNGDAFAMEPNALHIWPRGGFMMIALPNADRSFTCTCFWPHTGRNGFDALTGEATIRAYFDAQFPDAVPLMPTLVEDYLRNPIGSLVTIRCRPWHRGPVVLIGDAAHAIVPFFGQGMNAAFEDCAVLDDCIERHGGDGGPEWNDLLDDYSSARRANADAIADLALRNFIEMRDEVASPVFLLKKRGEKLLHRWLPRWYTPLYNMVTFSTIPYAAARRRARRQGLVIRMIAVAVLVALALVAVAGLRAVI